MIFGLAVALVAVLGGTMTAIAGAGTGSTLVPLFALEFDFKLAVAAVALPHLSATAVRALQLRQDIDWSLFLRFGLICAAASLIGALMQSFLSSPVVTYAFAILLVVAGLLGLTGISARYHAGRTTSPTMRPSIASSWSATRRCSRTRPGRVRSARWNGAATVLKDRACPISS
ncbi:sulfite exporter TauE/SafE family protein [Bradyrhizobium sp. ISRA443]|uniref:sulfite exporter TauE/SafE family protein n=1 Tax=unclassified Bradyrhizobium TaxID=2631580 RepID=UPI0032AFFBA3